MSGRSAEAVVRSAERCGVKEQNSGNDEKNEFIEMPLECLGSTDGIY